MDIKKSEEAIRFKAIFENAIDGIITIDTKGTIESINPAAANIFGYEPVEVIGKNVNMLMPEPDHSRHDSYLSNYLETHHAKIIGIGREVKGKRKDGSIFPFLLSISEIRLENKTIFTGIIHDISKLKLAEAHLVESELKINSIINAAVDGIITINVSGIIEMVNPSAAKLLGYEPSELMGKNVCMIMPEPDRSLHDAYVANYLRTGNQKIIGKGREVTAMKKDGTKFPCYLSISEVNLMYGKLFTGFLHDISKQKISEEKLRRYNNELERSNMELQDFAYVSSHDLQEPLRKIQAFGDRIKTKERDALSDQGKDFLDRMLNAAVRMQKLINDLLTFSRITTEAAPFEKVNLSELIKEVLTDLEITIERTKAKIVVAELPEIEADPTQMRQLFQNLILNAIKFRKQDQIPEIKIYSKHIQKTPHLSATPGDEVEDIYIEDNGIGFEEIYLDKIFNIFQRLEGQKYEGSGIGLSICRKIAIRHGGNITARSKPGEGATFIVSLAKKQLAHFTS